MLILVCGSRNWEDQAAINTRVALLPPGAIVLQGGAHRRSPTTQNPR